MLMLLHELPVYLRSIVFVHSLKARSCFIIRILHIQMGTHFSKRGKRAKRENLKRDQWKRTRRLHDDERSGRETARHHRQKRKKKNKRRKGHRLHLQASLFFPLGNISSHPVGFYDFRVCREMGKKKEQALLVHVASNQNCLRGKYVLKLRAILNQATLARHLTVSKRTQCLRHFGNFDFRE